MDIPRFPEPQLSTDVASLCRGSAIKRAGLSRAAVSAADSAFLNSTRIRLASAHVACADRAYTIGASFGLLRLNRPCPSDDATACASRSDYDIAARARPHSATGVPPTFAGLQAEIYACRSRYYFLSGSYVRAISATNLPLIAPTCYGC